MPDRQVQVQQDDVVIVEFAEIDTLFAQIGGVDVEALEFQHQLNRLSSGAVVLNQQDAHFRSVRLTGGEINAKPVVVSMAEHLGGEQS